MSSIYLITHLKPHMRDAAHQPFEVQLVDEFGHDLCSIVIDESESNIMLQCELVPVEVIEAAKRLPIGGYAYIDENGYSTYPGD